MNPFGSSRGGCPPRDGIPCCRDRPWERDLRESRNAIRLLLRHGKNPGVGGHSLKGGRARVMGARCDGERHGNDPQESRGTIPSRARHAGLTDGELLERFASSRGVDDEVAQAAFTALVDRHGNMVLPDLSGGTCARISRRRTRPRPRSWCWHARPGPSSARNRSRPGFTASRSGPPRRNGGPRSAGGRGRRAGRANWQRPVRSIRPAETPTPTAGPNCMRS